MTNTEILKADLLDILFDKRNKDYGAYVLRRDYHLRLLASLAAGLLLAGMLVVAVKAGTKTSGAVKPVVPVTEGIVIRSVELPKVAIKEPEQPAPPAKKITRTKSAPVARIKYTAPVIKKDAEVKEALPAVSELDGKNIAELTAAGKETDGKAEPLQTGTGNSEVLVVKSPVQPDFSAEEKEPQFPGGPEALKQFMARNLGSPGYLDAGEKVVVQLRFMINKDGSVSHVEILQSGGAAFDKEVVRVVRKMPRWTPALQNGINVPVNYVLPVTFIGTEG